MDLLTKTFEKSTTCFVGDNGEWIPTFKTAKFSQGGINQNQMPLNLEKIYWQWTGKILKILPMM
jgi:hypothetical protein